ncbi:MAG: CocE/NonD family hydrolase [Mycobacterium sp.]
MNAISYLLQRRLNLPPPLTRKLVVQRDLRVPMPDGVELLANRWAPGTGGEGLPTALIRTPYGRAGAFGMVLARPLAERGYQVLIQSTRGGFGSGGTFEPLRREREDGLATVDWVINQPWFGESMVLVGLSYLGYVQWAIADALPAQVKAMIPQVSESALTLDFLRGDAFSLETPFGWGVLVATMERPGALLRSRFQARKTRSAVYTLPLGDADVAALGRRSGYIQDILSHDADDPYWAAVDHRGRVAAITVPVSSIGGWYDFFLPGQLRDFRILQDTEAPARLTIGPWTHAEFTNAAVLEAVDFGLAYARGEQPSPRAPARLYVMGEEAWRDFDSWPPKGYVAQRFYLQPHGGLSTLPAAESQPDSFRYDPADPTPAVGGARLTGGGRVDNKALEARADVLTYTTASLGDDVEVIGDVSAEVWFRSSQPYADVFVRLCDVDERGGSCNVCDGLVSLSGVDEITCATVRLWPTAHRFKRGHRIRLQVSSGAFPRYARNTGTGEPHATAKTLKPADQTVYHDAGHPSAVILPVRQPTASITLARKVRTA